MIKALQLPSGAVTLLHAGPSGEAPSLQIPDDAGWTWSLRTKEGEPAEVILQTAEGEHADLIMMTTEGPQGFLDALRGSTSERVLRKARCPVASLPVGSFLS
jgi:nucleotide-binding universal stress UspA family protein